MLTRNYIVSIILISALGLFSCVPVKRISYVQSADQKVFHGEPADIRIRPGDEIYIRIGSADEGPANAVGDINQRHQDPRLLSYIVNDQGMVKLPYIGRVSVVELTLDEASDKIETGLSDYLYLPTVFMRFMNTRVTVLGEVRAPGVYMFDNKNANVLQAVGFAGDITDFGNRRKVLIIREDGGKREKHYLDLTSANLLESEWYNLKSGDIVFIEPLGRKKWGLNTVPYNLILTLITTSFVIYNFIQNVQTN